jgi:NADPH2:quinone reductase
MWAVEFSRFGDPREVLTAVERPLPLPGPGEVRVKLRLSPIHNHDLMIIAGQYGTLPKLPAGAGTESVGLVDALGEGVAALAIGQRVVTRGVGGTWAEYYLAKANQLVPVPDAMSDEIACQLFAMPSSAFMLLKVLDLTLGQWLVQNAANGLVGKVLAHVAAGRGLNVVNLVRSAAGVAELAAEGIDNAVATESPDWRERVLALAGGAPIVAGIDSIGGTATDDILDVMARDCTLLSFGGLSGQPSVISSRNLLFKRAVVKGYWGGVAGHDIGASDYAEVTRDLLALALAGRMNLRIAKSFPVTDPRAAATASLAPGKGSKIAFRG